MSSSTRLQLSLSDIARLAGVQRPVVSMWRQRPLARRAFPDPVSIVAGEERFSATVVADYLAATGRGNNPEAADDLAAYAQLSNLTGLDAPTVILGLTALLCLVAASDSPLGTLTPTEILDLARTTDPEDSFLRREITALGSDLTTLATHADSLADASYSPPAAFERLLHQHAQHAVPGVAAVAVTAPVHDLVAHVARAVAARRAPRRSAVRRCLRRRRRPTPHHRHDAHRGPHTQRRHPRRRHRDDPIDPATPAHS